MEKLDIQPIPGFVEIIVDTGPGRPSRTGVDWSLASAT